MFLETNWDVEWKLYNVVPHFIVILMQVLEILLLKCKITLQAVFKHCVSKTVFLTDDGLKFIIALPENEFIAFIDVPDSDISDIRDKDQDETVERCESFQAPSESDVMNFSNIVKRRKRPKFRHLLRCKRQNMKLQS